MRTYTVYLPAGSSKAFSLPASLTGTTFSARMLDDSDGVVGSASATATYVAGEIPSSWTNTSNVPGTLRLQTNIDSAGYTTFAEIKVRFAETSIAGIDADVQTALNGKANSTHTHEQSDITGLSTALSGKMDSGVAGLPAGTTLTVHKSAGVWPARPTSRSDIVVQWVGADPSPSVVSSGTGGMLDNVDLRYRT